MPVMDGWEVLAWVGHHHPFFKSLASILTFFGPSGDDRGWRVLGVGTWLGAWLGSLPLPRLASLRLEQFLVLCGCLIALLATANGLVRSFLTAGGVRLVGRKPVLLGGRLIGPMERVLIFGLVVAGELTGAALVASAKSLLRFREISGVAARDASQTDGEGDRRSLPEVSEYFLVGSFASWLLALAAGALFRLTS